MMTPFVRLSVATPLAAAAWVVLRGRFSPIVKLSGAIGALVLGWLVFELTRPSVQTMGSSESEALVGSLMYACMVGGMAAKSLTDSLGRTPQHLEVRDFILPLAVSPIVFGAIWKQAVHTVSVDTLVMAFQNGFFWKALFDSIAPRRSKAPH